jgi:hypothetical protein
MLTANGQEAKKILFTEQRLPKCESIFYCSKLVLVCADEYGEQNKCPLPLRDFLIFFFRNRIV